MNIATTTFYALLRPGLSRPEHLVIGDSGMAGMHALNLHVHREDMGRIIGRQGANILALNDLAEYLGTALGEPIRLLVPEPESPAILNRSYIPRRWTTDFALEGIQAYLTAARTGCRASFVPRPDQAMLAIAPALPLAIAGPLDRWLGVLGNQGRIRLSLEAAIA